MKTKLFLLICFSALCAVGMAQADKGKLTIKGTVLDASGIPVRNAIIMIDGRETKSVTTTNGSYRVRVNPDAKTIGIFTFGNGMIGEDIEGRSEINFRFGSAVQNTEQQGPGDEAVNTGYGSERRKDLTTDIDKIDGTDKKFESYSSIYEMIQRECSGVTVTRGTIIIQDARTLQGHVPPLFVVDGTYVDDISHISPRMVESIQVLKGTSAAIYGSRGYGGAIIITTKKKN